MIVILLLLLSTIAHADGSMPLLSTPPSVGVDCLNAAYSQTLGDGLAAIGNSEARNAYRGSYWTGKNKAICSLDVKLAVSGSISSIDYKATVWSVDPQDALSFDTLLSTSATVHGNSIVNGGWTTFTFPAQVELLSGKTVILISRTDVGTTDGSNYISIYQEYDETDSISEQWNSHYYSNGVMAGRGAGDEDQPEYYANPFVFYGENITLTGAAPNIPENINVTAVSSFILNIEWTERGSIPVDTYNVYEYNMSTATETLACTAPGVVSGTQSCQHTGLSSGATHYYVVRAVSGGVEGWHSIDCHQTGTCSDPDWRGTTL